jgi:carbamoyltransferase
VIEAADRAAQVLARGGFVAWYEGRSEHGPRALGSRSILSSPLDDGYRWRLNDEVKFREPFRPVAPVVREEDAAGYFDLDRPSPYMMRIVDALPPTVAAAPAAVHRDNTSRVQTVAPDSGLGLIASRFGELTGTPIVINTSLNVRSPIVETPAEALEVFRRSPIDLLFADGWLADASG